MAGVSRLQYTNEIRLIRVMCSGRVDPEFILRAFMNGMDGVFIGGCRLNECNYITHGNYDALSVVNICRKLLERIGLDPERLSIEFMSGGDGILLTRVIDDFTGKIKKLGPAGKAGGMDERLANLKLKAAKRLIPYIKLVERERLRVPVKSEEAYDKFFASAGTKRLFDELIGDKLAVSQIVELLREKPLSIAEISKILNLNPSEVSRHMSSSSRHGFIKHDEKSGSYAIA